MLNRKIKNVHKRNYASNEEAINAYRAALIKSSEQFANIATSFMIAISAARTFDIVQRYDESLDEIVLYVWDYEKKYHRLLSDIDVNNWIALAQQTLRIKTEMKSLKSSLDDQLRTTVGFVFSEIDTYKEAPDHLICFKDCVFDSKLDDVVPNALEQYHFVYRVPHNLLEESDPLHIAIAERIMNEWASGNAKKAQFLWDLTRCVIEGNNKGKFVILKAPGGNGKSAFISILSKIVGNSAVFPLNIQQMENDFMLEGLKPATRLICGDELEKDFLVKGSTSTKIKSFTGEGDVRLNRKMKTPITLKAKACIIQSTNSSIRLSEINEAFDDRAVVYDWSTENFRKSKEANSLDFDLKALSNDEKFIAAFMRLAMRKTKYSKSLHVPDILKKETHSHVADGDNFLQFTEYLLAERLIQHNRILHSAMLYEMYIRKLKHENPAAEPMRIRTFNPRMKEFLESQGFSFCPELSSMSKTSFADENKIQIAALLGMSDFTQIQKNRNLNRSTSYVNDNQALDKSARIDFKQARSREEKYEEMRKIISRCYGDHDSLVLSEFKAEIEDFY